jgi:hypothetical protein
LGGNEGNQKSNDGKRSVVAFLMDMGVNEDMPKRSSKNPEEQKNLLKNSRLRKSQPRTKPLLN